ncbi:lipase [Paraglaciecola aquimarina]|uniref:Lipase n=1 Tax=Paraglaciecola algarum TaxID=3050085 RepID=A0ABS9D278_9ALTE|nr:VolA/Pla-1 family phospholipase [Paraglaciecola sp. G1-23]MCF2947011.1 lipase [Paraglaciecola sp. G1-23]
MNKALVSIWILCGLGLVACGGSDSSRDDPIYVEPETPETPAPYVRVVFDPANSDINVPNDLLMIPDGDFFDFTINTEGSDEFDPANPQHALSALDGWSVHYPMSIRFNVPDGMDIDPTSVNADSIKLFEATQALEGDSAQCQTLASLIAAPGVPCELGKELVYGEDFVASYTPGSGSISVVPLKVLNASQGHLLVVTNSLLDTSGRMVRGSFIWDIVRQNIETNLVGIADLVPLQTIVNFMVTVLEPAGIPREELSYAAYFTTQSVGDSLSTVKKLNIAPYATALQTVLASGADLGTAHSVASQYLPSITTHLPSDSINAFEAIAPLLLSEAEITQLEQVGLNTCQGLLANLSDPSSPLFDIASSTFAVAGPFCAATIVSGDISLPYYLDPIAPKSGWWKAACTSGATLNAIGVEAITGLLQAGQVGNNNTLCQLASDNQLFDLDLTSAGMSDPRNITKFNPIPMARGSQIDNPDTLYNEQGTEAIKVHFTIPNEAVIGVISAATNGAVPMVTKPGPGWPVILFQHGITGSKENVLALSAAFSLAGFATVAIDHPLHGERGLMALDGSMANATSNSIADYLNFASLLTGRDNARQSAADIMGLRLGLNSIIDNTNLVSLDLSKVHFIGHSLGSITGTAALATANTSLGGELASFDSMYKFNTAVLNVPGGGVPSFVLESPDFGPLVKGGLLAASSLEFGAFLTEYATSNELSLEEAIRPAFNAYLEVLTPEQLAPLNDTFAAFGFAAQTVLDAADPIGYADTMANNTSVLVQLLVGGGTNDDGSTAVSDEANLVTTSLPLVGGQPLADLLKLEKISNTTNSGGVVRMLTGNHFSLFVPDASASATMELHSQATSFFGSNGQSVIIANPDVVEN